MRQDAASTSYGVNDFVLGLATDFAPIKMVPYDGTLRLEEFAECN
jgi:hypothetical protein